MKSYIEIQVPSVSLAASRGVPSGPAGSDSLKPLIGRVPGPIGADLCAASQSRFIEETVSGGSITLEFDNKDHTWRITPPAYANWNYYFSAPHGKWARRGDEITVRDAISNRICFSLKQANKMFGRAQSGASLVGRCELNTEWKRVPKPLPISGQPHIWYGLAIGENSSQVTGQSGAAAVVVSADRWFTFFMPGTIAGASKGFAWNASFVLLTGYIDRGDLIAHRGTAADYQFTLGGDWRERAGPLNQAADYKFEELIQFALRNAEMLRGLGMSALQGTCVDYDEKQVIIGDLLGAHVGAGVYSYLGECVPLSFH